MENQAIVVVSTGMITSVGNNAAQTAANARAKVSRFGDIALLNEFSKPYIAAQIPREALGRLPETITRRDYFGRRHDLLLRMASVALGECKATAGARIGLPPLFFAMPEHENPRPVSGERIVADLAAVHPRTFDQGRSQAKWKGRAGGFQALGEAIRLLQSGQSSFAFVGGADTYIDPSILPVLARSKRPKSDMYPDSFVPGEGGAFVLVATREAAQKAGLQPLAVVASVAEGHEPGYWGSNEPYLGDGLATTVQNLLQSSTAPAPIQQVYSTMNGESYWAKEWGVTRLRNAAAFAEDEQMNHPAEFFGDTGAAAGPILLGLAVLSLKRQRAHTSTLVYASSDFGARAATWIAPIDLQ